MASYDYPTIGNLPLGEFLKKYETLEKLNPTAFGDLFDKYRGSLNKNHSVSDAAFTTWEANRLKQLSSFKEMLVPDGTTVEKKMKKNEEAVRAIDEKLATAQVLSEDKKNELKEAKDLINIYNEILKRDHVVPYDLKKTLYNMRQEAIEKIKEQHQAEKTNITALFSDSEFVSALRTGLNVTDATKEKFQNEFIAELEKKQQTELQQFETNFTKEINKLHTVTQNEVDRIGFMGLMLENDEAARKRLYALAQKRAAEDPNKKRTTLTLGYDPEGLAILKGAEISDFDTITTLAGTKISISTQEKDGKKDCTLSITFPSRLNIFYYYARDQKIDSDFKFLIEAAKSSNPKATGINIQIRYQGQRDPDNPDKENEFAMELGRRAYEQAVRAGYSTKEREVPDPKDPSKKITKSAINIVINGKTKTVNELFAGHSMRLQKLQVEAQKLEKERSDFAKRGELNQKDFKQEALDIRARRIAGAIDAVEPLPITIGSPAA